MIIEDNKNNVTYTMFMSIPNGTVFKYEEDYYLRIESVVDSGFINATIINCVRLNDGAAKHLDNNVKVLIPLSKLVIN